MNHTSLYYNQNGSLLQSPEGPTGELTGYFEPAVTDRPIKVTDRRFPAAKKQKKKKKKKNKTPLIKKRK
jgi:hypothetical protein